MTHRTTTWVAMTGGALAGLLAMAGCGQILGVEKWSPGDGGAGGSGISASAGNGGASSSGSTTCACTATQPDACMLVSACDDPTCVFKYFGTPDAPGNCKATACDDHGALTVVDDPDDAKPDTPCVAYTCVMGMNVQNKAHAATPCEENGTTGFCSANGYCLTNQCDIDCCCAVTDKAACAPSLPSHCCNGMMDLLMGEVSVDCGGSCPPCPP